MTRGLEASRSEEHVDSEVMFCARADMRLVQVLRSALQEASRVWVMRTTDLEAWKKEFEFCYC